MPNRQGKQFLKSEKVSVQWFLVVRFVGDMHAIISGRKILWGNIYPQQNPFNSPVLLSNEDEAPDTYKKYKAWVDTQMGKKIKILNSGRGGKYKGKDFTNYLKTKSIIQKLNVHDTPQYAGVAEC